MSNVKLMRGEGTLSLLRGVTTLTRDIKRTKSWVTLHDNEVVDKYPEYGTYYMGDDGIKRRVQAKTHERWGLEYYSTTLEEFIQSSNTRDDGTESKARHALERVLQNADLIALMRGAQYVPKLVVTRVLNPRVSRHVGVYTLKSIPAPAANKFDVKQHWRKYFGYMKSWKTTKFVDSQLALDFLAFVDKYEVTIAKASLKLKTSRGKAEYEYNKRDLEYANANLNRKREAYHKWLVEYDDFKAKWNAQQEWLSTMPNHLQSHDVTRHILYTQGAVQRDPVQEVKLWDRDIERLTKEVAKWSKMVKDYEDVHGGEEE